jgi:hypothetical protein
LTGERIFINIGVKRPADEAEGDRLMTASITATLTRLRGSIPPPVTPFK